MWCARMSERVSQGLAADSADGVGSPGLVAQGLRHLTQDCVTGFVAVGVVDLLEMIDVDHGHGDRPNVPVSQRP